MTTDAEKLALVRAWLKAQRDAVGVLGVVVAEMTAILDAPGPVTPPPAPAPIPPCRVLVPLYVYPSAAARPSEWAAVAKLGRSALAIVNPSNGDFASADAGYAAAIAQLDAAGVPWVGYVATGYGKRPLADVINDIETWLQIYPSCRGYFLDEQASEWLPIYATIIAACRVAAEGGTVVSNPGLTGCDEKYLALVDVLVMSESAAGKAPALQPWAQSAPDGKIAILAHGVATEAAMRAIVAQSKAAGYGLIYVTNRVLGAGVWSGLPTYWPALVEAVAAP